MREGALFQTPGGYRGRHFEPSNQTVFKPATKKNPLGCLGPKLAFCKENAWFVCQIYISQHIKIFLKNQMKHTQIFLKFHPLIVYPRIFFVVWQQSMRYLYLYAKRQLPNLFCCNFLRVAPGIIPPASSFKALPTLCIECYPFILVYVSIFLKKIR